MDFNNFKKTGPAWLASRFPFIAKYLASKVTSLEYADVPWQPVTQPLFELNMALVTTAGVHHKDQQPFDMQDENGDPSYRIIDAEKPVSDLTITHDYYDHTSADKDINVVFPIERFKEMESAGKIKSLAQYHYSFMGHIVEEHVDTLVNKTAPEIAVRLEKDGVDAVFLTPG